MLCGAPVDPGSLAGDLGDRDLRHVEERADVSIRQGYPNCLLPLNHVLEVILGNYDSSSG